MLLSDVYLSVAYTGPNSRTERKIKIGIEIAHVRRDSDTTFKTKTTALKTKTRPQPSRLRPGPQPPRPRPRLHVSGLEVPGDQEDLRTTMLWNSRICNVYVIKHKRPLPVFCPTF